MGVLNETPIPSLAGALSSSCRAVQPEVNPHDNRMVPNTFEGVTLTGNLGPATYFAGFLTSMKTRDADDFVNMAEITGVDADEPMYLGGITVSPTPDQDLRTSLYAVPNLLASFYGDGSWNVKLAGNSQLTLSGQAMIQTGIGEALLTGSGFTPWVLGIMGELSHSGFTFTAGYTVNGSDDKWQSPYGGWPGYTSMLINDFDRAGEQALLLGASYDFKEIGLNGLSAGALAATDTVVRAGQPKWTEYDLSASYSLSAIGTLPNWLSPLSFSAYYAILHSHDPDGKDDPSDQLRLILNHELKATGKDL